jgi:hypothetical protein
MLEKSAATITPQDYEHMTSGLCAAMGMVVKELELMTAQASVQTRAA